MRNKHDFQADIKEELCLSKALGKICSLNNTEIVTAHISIAKLLLIDLSGNKNRFESYSTSPNMFSKTAKAFLVKNNFF